ncbi:MAG: N-acetyl-gamma-glutamyl-phosphate reductase [Pedobacter sp.]|nr:MAG: N-acetyl-gamma-glutamyl-phosphate reductase [Pedobacter sp.]
MSDIIKVGIIGGAGYTGGELLRLIINHPHISVAFVHSNSNGGKPVHAVHADLFGDTDLYFTNDSNFESLFKEAGSAADFSDCALFLCVGHGDAKSFLEENNIPQQVRIIDLSQDFRLKGNSHWLTNSFVYGLPELNKAEIQNSKYIANPGCFATCIQLALLPLAKAGKLNNSIQINATTGSTGAGQSLSKTSHFSWRNNNLSAYKIFTHQHLLEIGESLSRLQPNRHPEINFIPQRGDFPRGIFASVYLNCDLSLEEANELYISYYESAPFTHVSLQNIDLKQVINTNKCLLYLEKHDDKLVIFSIIDNLLKGASGQALQNFNLMFGFPEKTGLSLKSIGF